MGLEVVKKDARATAWATTDPSRGAAILMAGAFGGSAAGTAEGRHISGQQYVFVRGPKPGRCQPWQIPHHGARVVLPEPENGVYGLTMNVPVLSTGVGQRCSSPDHQVPQSGHFQEIITSPQRERLLRAGR